jgi:hypothetical protein
VLFHVHLASENKILIATINQHDGNQRPILESINISVLLEDAAWVNDIEAGIIYG